MKDKLKNILKNINLLDIISILIISSCFALSNDLINDRTLSLSFGLFLRFFC